jgi:hypothetical protein
MSGLRLAAIAAPVIAVGVLVAAGPVSAQESIGAGSAPVTTVPSATFAPVNVPGTTAMDAAPKKLLRK